MSLADAVLLVHFLIAAFITAGFVVIPLGAWFGWSIVRRRGLRLAHLGGIVFVALEAVLGVTCPLTAWEESLRGTTVPDGFIAFWVRHWLYYDVPLWIFGIIYLIAAAAAVYAWFAVPPARRTARVA